MHRVDAAPGEGLQNHLAGVPLVILVNLFGRQLPCAGHRAVKIIGVGGAKGGQIPPRLGEGHRVGGVGMHDAPQLRVGLVQLQMGLGVAAGVQPALDLAAVQVQHHQLVRGQFLIRHARRLDDHQPGLAVDARDIAPGVGHQPPAGQFHVCRINLLFQFFQHRLDLSACWAVSLPLLYQQLRKVSSPFLFPPKSAIIGPKRIKRGTHYAGRSLAGQREHRAGHCRLTAKRHPGAAGPRADGHPPPHPGKRPVCGSRGAQPRHHPDEPKSRADPRRPRLVVRLYQL